MGSADSQSEPSDAILEGRFGSTAGLRSRTARGTIVNGTFLVAANALGLIRAIAVAALLPTAAYGLWGLLMAAFMSLLLLGSVGIDDKYIQQDDVDQRRAFEIAFTLQVALGAVFSVVILVGMPLLALLYGQPEIIAPGAVLALAIPAMVLQMPLWAHYRRMDFVRQRKLQLVDPVVTLFATIGLALAGLQLWALVLGALAGTWTAAVVVVRSSPYRLRLRWERASLSEYRSFSWPLFVGTASTILLIQVPVAVASRVFGVTAVAGITLATNISQFAGRVDDVVTQTLYPAICAVKDRSDLLFESFWKSNRLVLLWAAPLGTAAALFAGDFVHHVLGEKWRFAAPLIAVYGLTAVVNQVGFNWTAYFRALGDTRPVAVASVVSLTAVMAIAVPLLITRGLTAFGLGLGIAAMISLGVRMRYLRRIFPDLPVAAHIARGLGPTIPAAATVLGLRALDSGGRSLGRVAVEALLFTAICMTVTYFSERHLLRESLGYLRRPPVVEAPA